MDREKYYQLILEQNFIQDLKQVADSFSDEQFHYRNFFNFFAREYKPTIEELDSLIEEIEDEDIRLHYRELKLITYYFDLSEKFPKLMKRNMRISNTRQRNIAQKELVADELFLKIYYFAKQILEEAPDSYLAGSYFARLVNCVGRSAKAVEKLNSILAIYPDNAVIIEALRIRRIETYYYSRNRKGYMNEVMSNTPFMYRFVLRQAYKSVLGNTGLVLLYFIGGIIMFFQLGENSLFIIYGLLFLIFWQYSRWFLKKGNNILRDSLISTEFLHITLTAIAYAFYLMLIQ
jgi:hypothetical protein